jgi:hypothetical protein
MGDHLVVVKALPQRGRMSDDQFQRGPGPFTITVLDHEGTQRVIYSINGGFGLLGGGEIGVLGKVGFILFRQKFLAARRAKQEYSAEDRQSYILYI